MEGKFRSILPKQTNELIAVDFHSPLPTSRSDSKYIFVIKNALPKLITLYPTKRAKTRTYLTKLTIHYFKKIGKPNRILSDHVTQFTLPRWRKVLKENGLEVCFSSARHPESNSVERTMRDIGRFFRAYCSNRDTNWANFVEKIENWLNVAENESTSYAPYELHFGRSPQNEILKAIQFPPEAQSTIHI